MSLAKDSPVWDAALTKARQEISDEILANNLEIVIKTNEQVLDRIENGDVVLRGDKQVRVPMKGRDLAVVGGIVQDKARVQLNLPTSIQGKSTDMRALAEEFRKLSQQWNEKQVNVVAVQAESEEVE